MVTADVARGRPTDLAVWQRGPVTRITIHVSHAGLAIGDIVLIWNQAEPQILVTDLGSGLERLAWSLTRPDWQTLVHGEVACLPRGLDPIRTATLILGSGIQPAGQRPGSGPRLLIRAIPPQLIMSGVSRLVRNAYAYWNLTTTLTTPRPEVARRIEFEAEAQRQARTANP